MNGQFEAPSPIPEAERLTYPSQPVGHGRATRHPRRTRRIARILTRPYQCCRRTPLYENKYFIKVTSTPILEYSMQVIEL